MKTKRLLCLAIGLILLFSAFGMTACNPTDDDPTAPFELHAKDGVTSDTLHVKKVENLADDFVMGMDASSVLSLEKGGVKFFDFDGTETDVFKILADNGINTIRVRVWNNPFDENGNGFGGGNCDIETAVEIGKRANKFGMNLMVDFHYSDFWADPSKQMAPREWQGMDLETKTNAVYEYTKTCLERLKAEKIRVSMVQVGNETNGAMCGEKTWWNITELMNAGSKAIRETYPKALVVLHFANPEKVSNYRDYEGLKKMAAYYASCGVTSFAPASMTLPYDVLEKAFATALQLADECPLGHARIMGIQMEGPYFSYKKRGAQNPDYLKEPDFEGFKKLYDGCGGLVRIVDVAPELPGAAEFVEKASKLCTVSIAHTDSDYDHARAAVDAGVTHLTHLYNAMPGIHHRNPGVIPAAVENPKVQAEIICDGYHIHPASVRLAFTMFKNRMILVSDSGRCAGMPEGTKFQLGGQDAWLREGVARLGDGTIACSATNLWTCLKNTISWGVPEEEALRAATFNPAKAIGADLEIGSIAEGKMADFIVTDEAYSAKRVFIAGREI